MVRKAKMILVDDDLWKRVKVYSAMKGISLSDFVIEALETKLGKVDV